MSRPLLRAVGRQPHHASGEVDLLPGGAEDLVLPAATSRTPCGIVKLTKSSSIDPQDTGLLPVANPPCWASRTAVSLNLTIPRRYQDVGATGLVPRPAAARRHWNRIPPRVWHRVVEVALADPARSPRELAWQFTDQERHFLSESSVYRILKAEDLITSPAYVVLSAAKTFAHPTHRPNELWQTDFTYLQVVGWGWYYLSTVLDDYSRYILAWTLRMSM